MDSRNSEQWRPLNIMLSMYGSRINSKLVFKYPFENFNCSTQPLSAYQQLTSSTFHLNTRNIVPSNNENAKPAVTNELDQLNSFSDDTLGNILSPGNTKICGQKCDVKINGIRFVGFPLLVEDDEVKLPKLRKMLLKAVTDSALKEAQMSLNSCFKSNYINTTISSFNVAFTLHATSDYALVGKYQDLCLRLAVAFRLEEKRNQYLSQEVSLMLTAHDEYQVDGENGEGPYSTILQKSKLARFMKEIFNCICENGVISPKVNNCIQINFCIPYRLHNKHSEFANNQIRISSIENKLNHIRPYHAILIFDKNDIFTGLPDDFIPSITRFMNVYEETKSLQRISTDADMALEHIYEIAFQLVYWGKACIIFPLCDTNVFVLSPTAQLEIRSELSSIFYKRFGIKLSRILAQFSLPLQLSQLKIPLSNFANEDRRSLIFWLLQHRFLLQIYTYLYFLPPPIDKETTINTADYGKVNYFSRISKEMHDVLKMLPESHVQSLFVLPASNNIQDLKSFINLMKYFDGKHHIEEIMYNENLTRTEILKILDKFKPVLLMCTREDPTTVAELE